MPQLLRASLVLLGAALLAHAATALLYETGVRKLATPALALGFTGLLILFARRTAWTWGWVRGTTVAFAVLPLVFDPSRANHGKYKIVAFAVATLLVVGSIGTFLAMRSASAQGWFLRQNEA